MHQDNTKHCIIIGASHAGVNLAFALRKEGWTGQITLLDSDPNLPYHRPPLSKSSLISDKGSDINYLKPKESYQKSNIDLMLGHKVMSINSETKEIVTSDGIAYNYTKLVMATGATPFIPPIKGLESVIHAYSLRTLHDVQNIRSALAAFEAPRIVIIGGGYIGLETAASLQKLGAKVSILERESRILARVTAPVMSDFFTKVHKDNGVNIYTEKSIVEIASDENCNLLMSADGDKYEADIIILGAGIYVSTELARQANLQLENGIVVDEKACTSNPDIYAIGDCSYHHNIHYSKMMRLESVQHAVDQAKVAAAAICSKPAVYNNLPWFWSDQYDIKLQIVGISSGYNNLVVRDETAPGHKFSVWYFDDNRLMAVDAVNHAKAYVIGTKLISSGKVINKTNLANSKLALNIDMLIQKD